MSIIVINRSLSNNKDAQLLAAVRADQVVSIEPSQSPSVVSSPEQNVFYGVSIALMGKPIPMEYYYEIGHTPEQALEKTNTLIGDWEKIMSHVSYE